MHLTSHKVELFKTNSKSNITLLAERASGTEMLRLKDKNSSSNKEDFTL